MSKISDQNILLRAQLTAAGGVQQNGYQDQSAKVAELEHQIMSLRSEKIHSDTRISFYESENARLLTEIEQFKKINGDMEALQNERSDYESKIEKMNKDQEDLLELLADQDNKLRDYKKRLKTYGQPVSDDDED